MYYCRGDRKWTANFENLVGAETYSLGCGVATFQQGGYSFRSVVCNYGPGLQEGFPVYQQGRPCDGCPSNWTCRNGSAFPYLCSREEQPLGKDLPIQTNAGIYQMKTWLDFKWGWIIMVREHNRFGIISTPVFQQSNREQYGSPPRNRRFYMLWIFFSVDMIREILFGRSAPLSFTAWNFILLLVSSLVSTCWMKVF